MEQFAPAAKLVPQLLANTNEEAFVPVTAILVIASVAVPVLVKVTDCDAVELPTGSDPNDRLVADSVAPGPRPVPVSATFWGEPPALSVMMMAAVNAPVAAGSKCPWMLQFAPAAKLVPQLLANTNEDAFVPVRAMLVMDKVALPVLVKVTACDAVAVPTAEEPNDRLVAESVAAGPRPVPVSATFCGDPPALSLMVMAAVSAPPVVGSKCP